MTATPDASSPAAPPTGPEPETGAPAGPGVAHATLPATAPPAPNLPVTARDVEFADHVLTGVAHRTGLELSPRLTEITGRDTYLKREDTQLCRSFKVRGAYTRMSKLQADERAAGVVCSSAGNHAQGVAYSCQKLQVRGTIYLPVSTPGQKRDRIQAFGGDWVELRYVDGPFDQVQRVALQDAADTGRTYIHPYDDPAVIAGQGSVAIELARQLAELGEEPGTVVIPVGGGGLIGGMSTWLKQNYPNVRVVGVESAGAASAHAARDHGAPIALDHIDSFVDGTAVGRAGDTTFALMQEYVDDIVVVDEGAVCTEMLALYQTEGVIAEPAGAMAAAALVAAAEGRIPPFDHPGPVVCVVSGGNNDLSRYAEVTERSQIYRGLRHYFLVTFPQRPGALRHFLDDVLGPADDIVFFEYTKKNNRDLGPALVGVDLSRPEDLDGLVERMANSHLHIDSLPPDSELLRFLI